MVLLAGPLRRNHREGARLCQYGAASRSLHLFNHLFVSVFFSARECSFVPVRVVDYAGFPDGVWDGVEC
jgi:hypothetical protein